MTAPDNPGEYSLTGHYAIPHAVVDSAMVMALFADLGQFQHSFAAAHNSSYRKERKIDAVNHNIFPKRPVIHFHSPGAKSVNLLQGKEAHLPVPVPGVGVSGKPVAFHQLRFPRVVFGRAFLGGKANCPYNPHHLPSP
jgi:hypothetical protein